MICVNCKKEHDGTYGNGRFCSRHCVCQFAGKQTKDHKKGSKRPRIEYICDICHMSFLGLEKYKAHKAKCTRKTLAKEGGWICSICSSNFRTRRLLQEHRKIHAGNKAQIHTKINFKCCFCEQEFFNKYIEYRTQHQNHCKMNPNAVKYKGHLHTEAEKKHLSECAKRNNFGGWHTSKNINYNGIKLDSSYEVAFAQDLDKNNIKWERPKPLYWKLNGSEHRYYPDFFLPDYNVYVDTKNDYLINHINPKFGITDVEKISLVEAQNNVKILILDKDNLSWQGLLNSYNGQYTSMVSL